MEFTKNNGIKLLDAAAEGLADDVVELVAQDVTLLYIADAMEDTAFHVAVRAGHVATVLKMVEFLKRGHEKVLKELLGQGNADGDRPLHLALKNGQEDLSFELALANTSAIYMSNKDDDDAIALARKAGMHLSYHEDRPPYNDGYGEVVVRLALGNRSATYTKIDQGMICTAYPDMYMHLARMDINDAEECSKLSSIIKEFSILKDASLVQKEEVIMEILEHNPKTLEYKDDSSGRNAFHEAASKGEMGILKKMFEFMLNHNNNLVRLILEGDEGMRTPLHLALYCDDAKVARYLVEVAPRAIYKEDYQGQSPLMIAIQRGYVDLVCYMIRTDFSQSVREHLLEYCKKVNMGHCVLITRNQAIFQALVEGLPEVINVPDRKGWKLLSYVAYEGYFDEVKCILKHIPNSTRKVDEDGSLPIHKAVAGGDIGIVKEFLLHCPEAIQDIDRKGRNLVEFATLCKQDEVLSYLKEKDQ